MDMLTELRRRLGVTSTDVPDDLLQHMLDVAGNAIQPWLTRVTVQPDPYQANIEEATVQLAIKVYDASGRGLVGVDATGEFVVPAAAATPGMVRSVFGALGPALATGGLSV